MHLVQVIGEAASWISEKLRDRYPVVPWRQIVGMRNRVVHSYFEVDLDILWFVVSVDVPDLAPKVWVILADIAPPEGKIDT